MAELELTGMGELLKRLEEMGKAAGKIEVATLKEAAKPIANDAKSLVNVSSIKHRHIRDDIKIYGVKIKDGVRYIEVGPGKDTNWRAKFLEWGTSKMTARPFLQPAYEKNKKNIIEIIIQKLREALGL
ncbi:HK97 gp10 family phage protein [Ruminiclostridium sufflavum DSM 19573]|uniref:HK97 gp10 family phage protein n=1 Tax=Ruminiclostridium sufflavum DSM 19573 TaxID=1121337 RepID=A0A318XI73_9FIRM|nr:HK97-gp10 family putative phage morphogenesis protein [Ruminiclostridium sufflavum]PYG84810.1 HK97 gp10 family phage protein [Ruminiclostridium sufflavum DSM 19573]